MQPIRPLLMESSGPTGAQLRLGFASSPTRHFSELPEALQAFELALPLNPKVGVQNACRGTPQEARALMIRLVSLGHRNHGYYAHQMGSVKDGR